MLVSNLISILQVMSFRVLCARLHLIFDIWEQGLTVTTPKSVLAIVLNFLAVPDYWHCHGCRPLCEQQFRELGLWPEGLQEDLRPQGR